MRTWTVPLLVAAVLAGCASRPAAAAAGGGAAAALPAASGGAAGAAAGATDAGAAAQRAASTLAVERQWLAAWFKGTPVVVAQRPDGALVVDVPRQFCSPGHER